MNQNLQNMLNVIQQNEKLSEDEKYSLLKSLKDADKELMITAFKLERTEKVKKTTAILLEETIEELEQKRKAVEAQNRELEIEASLERVRTVAMGMNKSDDLLSICEVSFKEFKKLGFDNLRNAIIHILNDEKGFFLDYDYSDYLGGSINHINYNSHPVVEDYLRQIKKADDAFAQVVIEGTELDDWKEFRRSGGQVDDPKLDETQSLYYYLFSIGVGDIGISTFSPIDDTQIIILKRFRNVFDLAYRRYNDIALAEVQAREAQIELALERVRARTMAMQKSDELKEVIQLVYEQFVHLNIHIEHTGFIMDYKARSDMHIWLADEHEVPSQITIPYFDSPHWNSFIEAKEKGKSFFTNHLSFEEKNKFYQDLFNFFPVTDEAKEYYFNCAGLAISTVLLENVGLYIENFSGTPYTNEENAVLMRFGKVFQQTYTRFLDLQKAEAQTREAQIEAALERVRSRSMAMHKSDELGDLSFELVKQVQTLGINTWFCAFNIYDDDPEGSLEWGSNAEGTYKEYRTPREGIFLRYWEAGQRGESLLINEIDEKECPGHYKYLCSLPGVGEQLLQMKDAGISFPTSQIDHVAYFKYGYIIFITFEPASEAHDIFKRFAKVFEQTYTRFLDLKKAEAQAREAQIEAALEKVRSRTMGMQKSEELLDTGELLYKELFNLGIPNLICGYVLMDEEKKVGWNYGVNPADGTIKPQPTGIPQAGTKILQSITESWKKQEPSLLFELNEEESIEHQSYVAENSINFPISTEKLLSISPKRLVIHTFNFKHGYLLIVGGVVLDAKQQEMVLRFTKVFEQTYTRFIDLQKSEAQAIEAQIEAALERVRSRSMAMHKTDELQDVVRVVAEELKNTGVILDTGGAVICTYFQDSKDVIHWTATEDPAHPSVPYLLPYFKDELFDEAWESKNRGDDYYAKEFSYDVKNAFFNYAFEHSDYRQLPDEYKKIILESKSHGLAWAWSKNSAIMIPSIQGDLPSEKEKEILIRFAKVFEQAYTRFLDLQKAEAQAREAQIEASLERLRAKSMSMQQSDELHEVLAVLCEQFDILGILPMSTHMTILDIENNKFTFRETGKFGNRSFGEHTFALDAMDTWKDMVESWRNSEPFTINRLHFPKENLPQVWEVFHKSFESMPEESRITPDDYPDGIYHTAGKHPFGYIGMNQVRPATAEEEQIVIKFANEFGRAYQRFLDLQKAEAQAREAIKQASLDRVRGEIASMRTAEDLNRITPVIWRELKTLDVPFFRCGVFIVNEDKENVQVYLTTPDGKSLAALNLSFDANQLTRNTVEHWKKKQVYKEHWNKDEFINWTKSMMELGQVQDAETYQGSSIPPESLDLHFVPFTQGMLYVGDVNPLTEEKLDLVKTLAEAFAIAYARYEDFKNLEEAKNKVELTLKELKSAQVQLIHSEKMASLGELTAGIAHEIKNPLNFVNNFSEVSRELLDEMIGELKNENTDEVIELIQDLKQNLEKINQHGKRADSIVKGMLLHSRGSSGEKTLTDINDLLDQYVNLAYHGMRAQNKEFNISIEKDYDESLEKINVIPQDISRVFLNIINNACYAAYDKKKKCIDNNFSPTLSVSTKNLNEKVEIRIKDNGMGIPDGIQDKLFNPFFTTKPTGEGTGLGLSLSYDIVVKQHSGEIKFESEEGKYTEFIINLPKQ